MYDTITHFTSSIDVKHTFLIFSLCIWYSLGREKSQIYVGG
jgi:hypothetical protein